MECPQCKTQIHSAVNPCHIRLLSGILLGLCCLIYIPKFLYLQWFMKDLIDWYDGIRIILPWVTNMTIDLMSPLGYAVFFLFLIVLISKEIFCKQNYLKLILNVCAIIACDVAYNIMRESLIWPLVKIHSQF